MAYDIPVGTNFAALQPEQRTAWAMELWKEVRNKSFVTKFLGTGSNAMIQRITELNASHKGGNKAIMTLLANADYTGVAGDNVLQGKEDVMTSYHLDIRFDQFRLAHANTGRMADQKSIINFRKEAKDQLSYGMANIIDELAFLTLSGVPYTLRSNGAARNVGSEIPLLEFADDVTAPTSNRHLRWDAAGKRLLTGDTTAIKPADKITYASLVELKAYLKDEGVRGIMEGGKEYFNVFVTPQAMAKLRLDPDYIANTRAAAAAIGNNSELFKGADDVTVDGLIVREYRHVFNTRGMAAGEKWGSAGDVEGARVLICGAQAMGMVDLGAPNWVEKDYDYENRFGIAVNKMFGFRKSRFHSTYSGSVQDFSVVALDVAI